MRVGKVRQNCDNPQFKSSQRPAKDSVLIELYLIKGKSSHSTHISHTFFTKRYLFVALV
jgi:hypothetical protein